MMGAVIGRITGKSYGQAAQERGWYKCHGCHEKIRNWIVQQRGHLWHPNCSETDIAKRLEPGEVERMTRDDGRKNNVIPKISTYGRYRGRRGLTDKGKQHRTKYAEPI